MSGRVSYLDSGNSYLGTEERGGSVEMGYGVREVTLKGDCQMRVYSEWGKADRWRRL